MNTEGQIPFLALAASAMDAQRNALDVYARNIAAAQVAGKDGFTRLIPTMELGENGAPQMSGVRSERVASGSIVTEMIAMMQSQRAYESDATMFSLSKHLAEQTLAIERT